MRELLTLFKLRGRVYGQMYNPDDRDEDFEPPYPKDKYDNLMREYNKWKTLLDIIDLSIINHRDRLNTEYYENR